MECKETPKNRFGRYLETKYNLIFKNCFCCSLLLLKILSLHKFWVLTVWLWARGNGTKHFVNLKVWLKKFKEYLKKR